jgi:transcriptional regulator with XRE-family HTH domain
VRKYAYVVNIGQLVANAKGSSGLPVRRLASDAHVAGSTITRIQAGVVDPSVDTLERILAAAGFDLEIIAVRSGTPRRPRLGELANAWSHHRGRLRLDWARWRGVLDVLALHPEWIPDAIYLPPPPAGGRVIDALLAAIAEKLADDAHLPRPAWTEQAPSLDEPYQPPLARNVTGRVVPTQLAARGLMIDSTSLWRDPETVGA